MIQVIIGYFVVLAIIIGLEYLWLTGDLRERLNLMWLAAKGEDYSRPSMPMGGALTEYKMQPPHQAENPVEAYLLLASEAERKYWALTHIVDDIEHYELERFVHEEIRRSRNEAKEAIMARAEMTVFEEGMNTKVRLTDPQTKMKMQGKITAQQMIRQNDPEQRYVERFPEMILQEVTDEYY